MTVNTTNITSGPYIGDGNSSQYSYTFRIVDKNQLRIFETTDIGVLTELIVDTDYTVTPGDIGNDNGGEVVRVAGNLPVDYVWYIRANYKDTQATAFASQGGFLSEVHENAFDKRTFVSLQQLDILNRSMRLADNVDIDGVFTISDNAAARASAFLGFDSNGDLAVISGVIVGIPVSAYMQTVNLAVDSAAARLLLAAAGLNVPNTFTSKQIVAKGIDIASAAALILGSDGNSFDVTGSTAIMSIATYGVGAHVTLYFDSILTLTHDSTNLILPGASDITTATGDIGVFYEYATGQWRCVNYTKASGDIIAGTFFGLSTKNDTDTNNDISIAVGECSDSGNNFLLKLSSTIIKQLDVSWTAGTNAGGLFSGSKAADTWYHIFLIRKDSDGSIDAGYDTSLSTANIPSGYTAYRRVGSILTDSSANIINFIQVYRKFYFKTPPALDYNANATTVQTLTTISSPLGFEVEAYLNVRTIQDAEFYMHSPDTDDIVPSASVSPLTSRSVGGAINVTGSSQVSVLTNASSQIAHRSSNTSNIRFVTLGWNDLGIPQGI